MDVRQKVLDLLGGEGAFLSIEALSVGLGLGDDAVRSLIAELRSEGVKLVEVPGRGFSAGPVADILYEHEVRRYLRTREIGSQIIFRHEVTSTNSLAMALAESGKPHGTVILADRQTGGKGRMGRSWISPAGVNLYLSLILRPDVPPAAATEVPIVLAVAAARALKRQSPPLDLCIKWPNDVYAGGKKMGGILCEMRAYANRIQYLVAGLGINVNVVELDEDLSGKATSMRLITGSTYLRPLLAADLLEEIETAWDAWIADAGLGRFMDPWRELSVLDGRSITVETGAGRLHGRAEGIASSGALLLRMDDGSVKEIYAGDAHIGTVG